MSTASKWFVPGGEFFASTEDYAIVGQPESMIHPLVRRYYEDDFLHDEDEEAQEEQSMTVTGEYCLSRGFGDMFELGFSEQLLYADVDCNDPEHKTIRNRIAAEGCLKEESEKSKEAREKLIEHLVSTAKPLWCTDLSVEETDKWRLKEREDRAQLLVDAPGFVTPRTLDYILSLEDQGERRETLKILSGQHLRKIQRPVLLLIGMVEKHSTKEDGTNEGWAVAYNFYEDRLIIKPFLSDEAHHPLTEKWDTDLPDDGISFSGRPSGIVERFWKIYSDIQKKEHHKDITVFSYRVLVALFTMRWIRKHWKPLCAIKHAEATIVPCCQKRLTRNSRKPRKRSLRPWIRSSLSARRGSRRVRTKRPEFSNTCKTCSRCTKAPSAMMSSRSKRPGERLPPRTRSSCTTGSWSNCDPLTWIPRRQSETFPAMVGSPG